ncbi:transporter substrate-binding domain-containing protein [Cypionkella sp.]|uniref:transporter substrate-binding domain-containing protein n=1 Tax=Cypionkella sp. TaxID=2811411 RepID=UPI002ABBE266|nr:transporter substrate-binding domain-containing protein [Cypionkella sp.]MDZ4394346.1 transporter substrate-binding domain-containing protein [Cypionkella sp.]
MKVMQPIVLGAAMLLAATAAHAEFGDTLKGVKERGALSCSGHNGSYPGMMEVDDKGNWKGFDIDMCRAVATAVFGTAEGHLNIQSTSWEQRWPSLQAGELDIVIKSSGWTMSRDTDNALQFSRPYMMAAISYSTHTDNGAKTVKDLDGGTVCVQAGTTLERYAADHAAANGYKLEAVPFESTEAAKAAFLSGRCDAFIEWDLQLAVMRATEVKDPASITILPDVLAAEPLGMIVRQGDDQWVDVANWVESILIQADEAGVTSANVDEMKANPPTPAVATMLGVTPGVGKRLGLNDDWAYQVIKQVGNYDEIWERNLGKGSAYGLSRGVNGLIRNGGILYSLTMD